jgi:hypothetical protein
LVIASHRAPSTRPKKPPWSIHSPLADTPRISVHENPPASSPPLSLPLLDELPLLLEVVASPPSSPIGDPLLVDEPLPPLPDELPLELADPELDPLPDALPLLEALLPPLPLDVPDEEASPQPRRGAPARSATHTNVGVIPRLRRPLFTSESYHLASPGQ